MKPLILNISTSYEIIARIDGSFMLNILRKSCSEKQLFRGQHGKRLRYNLYNFRHPQNTQLLTSPSGVNKNHQYLIILLLPVQITHCLSCSCPSVSCAVSAVTALNLTIADITGSHTIFILHSTPQYYIQTSPKSLKLN